MAIGIHRSRPRCGVGGKNSAGTDRKLYAVKGTSRLGRERPSRGSSSHAYRNLVTRLNTLWLGRALSTALAARTVFVHLCFFANELELLLKPREILVGKFF